VSSTLSLADSLGVNRIGFPGIGTGVYRWPPSVATLEIVESIAEWIQNHQIMHLKEIYLFDLDSSTVNEFYNSLSTLNENQEKSATTEGEVESSLSENQWYRVTLSHEPDFNHPDSIPVPNSTRTTIRLVPYGYDRK